MVPKSVETNGGWRDYNGAGCRPVGNEKADVL